MRTQKFLACLLSAAIAAGTCAAEAGAAGDPDAEAAVGGNTYPTLESAVSAAADGDTVRLLKDVSLTQPVFIRAGLTLDLSGRTVAARNGDRFSFSGDPGGKARAFTVDADGKTVTCLNGRIDAVYGSFLVEAGTLDIGGKAGGQGVAMTNLGAGWANVEAAGGAVNVYGADIFSLNGSGCLAAGPGAPGSGPAALNIYGGTYRQMGCCGRTSCCVSADGSARIGIAGGDFSSSCGYAVAAGVGGSSARISGGTFTASGIRFPGQDATVAVQLDEAPEEANGAPQPAPAWEIGGGDFSGGLIAGSGAGGPLCVTGGCFTSDPSGYVDAETHHAEFSDKAGYNVKVVPGKKAEPAVPAQAAPAGETAAKAAGGLPDRDDIVSALNGATADGLGTIAKLEAENRLAEGNLSGSGQAAVETAKEAVGRLTSPDVGTIDGETNPVVVVAQPYLDITAKAYEPGAEGTAGTLELEITPKCKLVATSKTIADSLNSGNPTALITGETEVGQNGVLVNDAPIDVPSGCSVTISIPLPDGLRVPESNLLQVKHAKADGSVYYYPAAISGGAQKAAVFTVTHGFSDFTLQAADTRMLTVGYDSGVSRETYGKTDVGSALPTASKPGYDFNGWTFDGAGGTYTTLTDALWDGLMTDATGNKTVSAAAQFTKQNPSNPGGAPVAPEQPEEPTATYKSDTTYDFTVNGAYTFLITSLNGKQPSFAVGTPGVFRTELVKTVGSDHYFKITAVGKAGSRAGIYLNGGSRLLVATVGKPAATCKSDTTYDLSVNGAYTFQITSLNGKKPSFAVGTPGVFRTELVKQDGSNYYYKITSVGKKGAQAGIYINGESRLLIATVK